MILRLSHNGVPIAHTLVCIPNLLDVAKKQMIYSWQSLRPIEVVERSKERGRAQNPALSVPFNRHASDSYGVVLPPALPHSRTPILPHSHTVRLTLEYT